MIKQKYTYHNFPAWAMSALVNDDYSSLEENDCLLVDSFLSEHIDVVSWDYESETLDYGNFKNYPLFGLASDCCTIHGYIKEVAE
jgi:hypothetical protein